MHVHLVFVTKFRHRVFADAHVRRMEEIMRSVCTDFECELVEFNGEDSHVHPLVNFPPKATMTKLINSLKHVSSHRLRQDSPDLAGEWGAAEGLGEPLVAWLSDHPAASGAAAGVGSRCSDTGGVRQDR